MRVLALKARWQAGKTGHKGRESIVEIVDHGF
jgi:hypothetical protein